MVPVVLGHGHSKVAPEGSFIDAGQFSPKELATLLSKLSKDENVEELLKYHAWKSVYQVYLENRDLSVCQLCAYLHDNTLEPHFYKDIHSWWVDDAKCKIRGNHPWSLPESVLRNSFNIIKDTLTKIVWEIEETSYTIHPIIQLNLHAKKYGFILDLICIRLKCPLFI